MKKIINNPSNFVEESIDGLIKSHPNIYAMAKDNNRVITRSNKASKKVGIVTGGGSGHLPVFTGYVGKGFLDACAIGSVFASPSVEQMADAMRCDPVRRDATPMRCDAMRCDAMRCDATRRDAMLYTVWAWQPRGSASFDMPRGTAVACGERC